MPRSPLIQTFLPSLLVTTRGTGALDCATYLLISYSDISSYFFNFLSLSLPLLFFYTKPLVSSLSLVSPFVEAFVHLNDDFYAYSRPCEFGEIRRRVHRNEKNDCRKLLKYFSFAHSSLFSSLREKSFFKLFDVLRISNREKIFRFASETVPPMFLKFSQSIGELQPVKMIRGSSIL